VAEVGARELDLDLLLVAEAARGERRLGAADALGVLAKAGRDLDLPARALALGG
jgi:hypothetical protein